MTSTTNGKILVAVVTGTWGGYYTIRWAWR